MPDDEKALEYLKRARVELRKARRDLQELEQRSHEPIAIVGLSCRYPGGVHSPEDFWNLVASGGDAISALPGDRGWDLDALYDPDPDHRGTLYAPFGGFLDDAPGFDADFFHINPKEALAMDPQHRLFLEASWEALEDGAIDPESLRGSRTGVFVGISSVGYGMDPVASAGLEGYRTTGHLSSVAAGRVAYTFGLEGPAVALDTACSSSLAALHLACQALRSEECSLALAGGVTALATPHGLIEFCAQRVSAPDGRCKSFANAADGAGWAEGVGVMLLERLSDAVRHDHQVLAVVRGSAMNQDGASNGLTAPNGLSQQRVIRQALADARLSPQEVDVVEAHGTGTTLGDPIEAHALLATYGQGRDPERPLWLGSVKSNVGHSGPAAGVAGVIKMVMAMRHDVLPRTLHVDEPSRHVDWSKGSISLLTQAQDWKRNGSPRRAGISGFGISGTNVHVVLEESPLVGGSAAVGEPDAAGQSATATVGGGLVSGGDVVPLVLSGKNDGALRGQAARLGEWWAKHESCSALDVGSSLVSGRSMFRDRAVVLGGGRGGLLGGLGVLAGGEVGVGVVRGVADVGRRVAFLFPGQGSQWVGMAVGLLDGSAVFAESVGLCGEALAPFVDWSLEGVLRGVEGAPGLDRVDVVQPVLWAVMVSLAELWRSCGVRPDVVVGHSQGEIAAACVAGGLLLEDGACVVALRSRALAGLAGRGGMVSVALSVGELERCLEGWGCVGVSVAAVNGPGATVVSGEVGVLEELLGVCEGDGVRARRIPVDYASHSPQIEEIRGELLEACASIVPRSGEVPFFSTVVGGVVDMAELGGEYWYRNLRETVRFEGAVRSLLGDGYRAFVEVSPHPVLTIGVQEAVEDVLGGDGGALVSGSLRRGEGGGERWLRSLAEVWVRGVGVDWERVFEGAGGRRVKLPTYAFQRERYWLESWAGGVGDVAAAGLAGAGHPLLGAAVSVADNGSWLFTGRISLKTHPWLADHAVAGTVLLAGTALLELAFYAGERVGCGAVRELTLEVPLVLAGESAVVLQLVVGEGKESGERSFGIYSHLEGEDPSSEQERWTRHASGTLTATGAERNGRVAELAQRATLFEDGAWPPSDAGAVDLDGVYDTLAEYGFEYGPVFQGLRAAWRRGEEFFAEIALSSPKALEEAESFGVHPALLDAAFHVGVSALLTEKPGDGEARGSVTLPFAFAGVELYLPGASALRVALSRGGDGEAALLVADDAGRLVASIDSLLAREVPVAQLGVAARGHRNSLFTLGWNELALPDVDPTDEPVVLIAAQHSALADALRERGIAVEAHPDLGCLRAALEEGATLPEHVFWDCDEDHPADEADEPRRAHQGAERALAVAQEWLAEECFSASRLVIVTTGAVATSAGEEIESLALSPVWGLVRSAQSEHPERFTLLDTDHTDDSLQQLERALATHQPQLALRKGGALIPQLAHATRSSGVLEAPAGSAWRLSAGTKGVLEDLTLAADPSLTAPLGAGQVRVGTRAWGLNFRDVMIALGMYPDAVGVGNEGAGVVLELGPGVDDLTVGDRVMGMFPSAGPLGVADRHVLARVPEGWSFAQAATVPVAFLTAYYALVDLAALQPGERVLVHAATGGVGMAAVQLARHLGAEVFVTASPTKWRVLRELGFDETHIASSRSLEFRERFLTATDGDGMNVVLHSLAGDFVDASLDLLGQEGGRGRLIELGKTDVRDPERVALDHPEVFYRAFELAEVGPERVREMLGELLELFAAGALEPLPLTAWDVSHAPEAFRCMSQARHIGKIVLSMPAPLDRDGTVLVTGGTGVLGGMVARHLAAEHGVRHLLLAGRRGEAAEGISELRAELESLGAVVKVQACDVSVRAELEGLLGSISAEHPLCGVVHTAGVLDDGVIESLTEERLRAVLTPKLDAAWHLHELTEGMDLAMFVLFSSAAGVFGSPGQGNYGAANAFLDALAAHRRVRGLPGSSLAWGLWEPAGSMTGHLSEGDLARMARAGMRPLSSVDGLRLFDIAWRGSEALMLPIPLELPALRALHRAGVLPQLFAGLVSAPAQRAGGAGSGSLARRLAMTSEHEREGVVLELVRVQVATVLGHSSSASIDPQRSFKELGFDSLTAVELRNRLNATTGLRLPATLVFDYPTPAAVTAHLLGEIAGSQASVVVRSVSAGALDEPMAIVGMSCRYPGDVYSPQQLWELVNAGGDAIAGFPRNRGWDLERLYDPDPDRPGTSYTRDGGFLYDADQFDSAFFGIRPREALAMDPQQRLLLESSWEVFEDAGIDPRSLKGTPTGVFIGIIASPYGLDDVGRADVEGYRSTGSTSSVASGRIAYTFGLEGPAISVDTACSSSLVALHLAGQALRSGECSLALVGGVAVIAQAATFSEFARGRVLSVDGRCKSFAAAADGSGFSDGVGMLMLERLSDARRNGHEVLGLVRGSAVNQDGASNGLAAPNGPAQQRVIAQALANAKLQAAQVDAVDAHGTGTALGDPIEAQALIATYGQGRPEDRPLWLGSIKSNIGHTQAAAGVAGVIKMVMAMRHGTLPKTLHVDEPTPNVDWSAGAISLLTQQRRWERGSEPRRAGVSAFGVSGTNAHVILEEAPAAVEPPARTDAGDDAQNAAERTAGVAFTSSALTADALPWMLSARDEGALRDQAERLREHVDRKPELGVMDVGFSLASRPLLEHRAVLLNGEREERSARLATMAANATTVDPDAIVRGVSRAADAGAVFMFPGQGAGWPGMGLELLGCSPAFAQQMRDCGEALSEFVDWSLEEVLRGEGDAQLYQLDVLIPTMFSLLVSVAALWRALGVRVAAVVGHSQGEIAAACVAGGLSLRDAARVAALRGRAMVKYADKTETMASVSLGLQALRPRLEKWGDRIDVAAVNGPSLVGLAGNRQALEELQAELEADGVRVRMVPGANGATHTATVELAHEELVAALEPIVPRASEVPFFSSVTGGALDTSELNAEYWFRNVRQPVLYEQAVRALLDDGKRAFIDVGTHPVLTMPTQQTLEEALEDPREGIVVGSLRRGEGGPQRFLKSAAEAWTQGVGVDWRALFAGSDAHRLRLPTYAFQRERYWLTSGLRAGDATSIGQSAADHPLLGAAAALADDRGWMFSARLSLESQPWLKDHAIGGDALIAGAGLLDLALAAGEHVGAVVVDELDVERPLLLAEGCGVQLQLIVSEPDEQGRRAIGIHSRLEGVGDDTAADAGAWTRHATGTLSEGDRASLAGDRGEVGAAPEDEAWPPAGAHELDVELLYDRLADAGYKYGPLFPGLRRAWRVGEKEWCGDVAAASDGAADAGAFAIHPALLDAALHVALIGELDGERVDDADRGPAVELALPSAFSGVRAPGHDGSVLRVRVRNELDALSLSAVSEDGTPVLSVRALELAPVDIRHVQAANRASHTALQELGWVPLGECPVGGEPLRAAMLGEVLDIQAPGIELQRHPDLHALEEAIAGGAASPELVLVPASSLIGADVTDAGAAGARARCAISRALELLQAWLASSYLTEAKLILLTEEVADVADGGPSPTAEDVARGETNGATPTGVRAAHGDASRLAQAALAGLVRSATSEHPGRFGIVDLDGEEASIGALCAACASEESELAVRGGRLLAPRLTRLAAQALRPPAPLDPDGTVLITEDDVRGSGALLVRHLVSEHGARHVLLLSRTGEEREGAQAFRAELQELGCEVRIAACDVSKRDQLEELLMSIPAEHPLCMVVHTAGLPDDGLIESLDGERLSRALDTKVDGAMHLHELAAQVPLILFSSVAATIGNAGQGASAAANAFLDALAAHRRAHGLPGVSVAWGVWERGVEQADVEPALEQTDVETAVEQADVEPALEQADVEAAVERKDVRTAVEQTDVKQGAEQADVEQGAEQAEVLEVAVQTGEDGELEDPGPTVRAGEPDASMRAHLARQGLLPLSRAQGLELFGLACGADRPLLLAARWDTATLRTRAKAGTLPAVLRGLSGSSRRSSMAGASLAAMLATSPEAEWNGIAVALVRGHIADVLGLASPAAVDLDRPLKDAGFDSLGALELKNRLSHATGLKLPATLIFDHPTPAAMAKFLLAEATAEGRGRPSIDEEIDRLEKMLVAGDGAGDGAERERIGGRLRALLQAVTDGAAHHDVVTPEAIEAASAEELVELIQRDLSEV